MLETSPLTCQPSVCFSKTEMNVWISNFWRACLRFLTPLPQRASQKGHEGLQDNRGAFFECQTNLRQQAHWLPARPAELPCRDSRAVPTIWGKNAKMRLSSCSTRTAIIHIRLKLTRQLQIQRAEEGKKATQNAPQKLSAVASAALLRRFGWRHS